MTTFAHEVVVRRPLWRRLLRGFLVTSLLAVIGLVVRHYWKVHLAQRDLDEVIARLDRDDPGWRLEDLEKSRKVIADAENSALIIKEIGTALPKQWSFDDLAIMLDDYPPNHRLRERPSKLLKEKLRPLAVQIERFRQLDQYSEGRHAISYSEDFFSTLVPHCDDTRHLLELGQRDALWQIEEGHWNVASRDCLAILNVARSIGDEPLVTSQLVHVVGRSIAVAQTQRLLAQGQASDASLAQLMKAYEQDAKLPLMQIGLRGERGGFVKTCDCLIQGKFTLEALGGVRKSGRDEPGLWDRIVNFTAKPMYIESQTWHLQHTTKALACFNLPHKQRRDALATLTAEADRSEGPVLARLLAPSYYYVLEAFDRSQAQLCCVQAALGVERYRLKHHRWPSKLDDLSPEFLTQVPVDPFDGQPLQFRTTNDGVVVFSPGPDGSLKGDYWDAPQKGRNDRHWFYEFRLWNPESRRLPALPPVSDEEEFIP